MKDRRNTTNYYVNAIIKDIQNAFVREETIIFSESNIERIYEFEDGAIIRYEWQSETQAAMNEEFNHRFSMIKLPSPNTDNFQNGIIKTISYGSR